MVGVRVVIGVRLDGVGGVLGILGFCVFGLVIVISYLLN